MLIDILYSKCVFEYWLDDIFLNFVVNRGLVVASKLTEDQIREIAEIKLPDLNAYDVESAMKIVAGTAKNMGVKVEGMED